MSRLSLVVLVRDMSRIMRNATLSNAIGILLLTVILVHSSPVHDDNHLETSNVENKLKEASYRLPKEIVPINYDLWLYTQLGIGQFAYHGYVRINLRVLNSTDTVIVHNDGLIIRKNATTISSKSNEFLKSIEIDNQDYDRERQFHVIRVKENMEPGEYFLDLYFEGTIVDDVFGFYRTQYKVNGETRYMGITQFSPTFARRAFPCLDEPLLKATFTLHIGHTKNQLVTSNTDIKNVSPYANDSNYCITTFSRTPRMSTYIVGWSVHDFIAETSTADGTFKIWTRPSMKFHGSAALNLGRAIYSSLKDWLLVENPIKKMDEFAVPDFYFNAMENWGLITFRESVGLHDESQTPTRVVFDGLTTMTHEYAHTWFGNLVTPEFWDVAWLKEGFASYFQYFGLSFVKPEWRMMDLFVVDILQPTLLLDSADHSRTMNGQQVGNPASIKAAMDFVAYKKGASIIRMLSHVIGPSVFQQGLQQYVKNMSYKAASPFDLYEYLQDAVDESVELHSKIRVKEFMQSWTTQVGYPLITVTRNYASQFAEVSQERFYQNCSQSESDVRKSRWWVPLSFITETKANFSSFAEHWLHPENRSLIVGTFKTEEWVILNNRQVGYYRVNYDEKNWRMLIDFLTSRGFGKINTVNRATLLDDAFNLARAGYVDYSIPFNLSRYLIEERDYVPWLAAVNNLKFLNTMLSATSEVLEHFQSYVRRLIEPTYDELSFSEASDEDWTTKLHRELILSAACSVNSTHCLRTSKTLFGSWIANPDKVISKDLRSFVYCTGISEGNQSDWHAVWDRLHVTDLHTEQELLYKALGCTQNTDLIDKYLNWSLSNGTFLRKQYRHVIFNSVVDGHPNNIKSVLNFMSLNIKKINNSFGFDFFNKVFSKIGEKIVRTEQVGQLQRLIQENADDLGTALTAANKALKVATANVEWIKVYSAEIARCVMQL